MTDLRAIEAALRRAPYLHAYELGDLDPAEAAHCTWWTTPDYDAIALLYTGLATPTVVGLGDDAAALTALLAAQDLPAQCYAHLSPGVTLGPRCQAELLSHNLKMALVAPVAPVTDAVVWLTPDDADEVSRFYPEAYPGNYFEPHSLARGVFVAVRDARGLAAIAGVHVYSPVMRVAALGSIATRPDARGRGLAGVVTRALCYRLQDHIDTIGLNVRADNAAAIACYRKIGFEPRHRYDEWRVTVR